MSRDDWYRNAKWNPQVEAEFREKLRRAKNKASYLRIQAGHLEDSHPSDALRLIAEYLALGEHFDIAAAHLTAASANVALENLADAVEEYRRALARERDFPKLLTQAYLEFPLLVAMRGLSEYRSEALDVLDQNRARPMFPVDHFLWNGAMALLRNDGAKEFAAKALEFSKKDSSGFQYHPRVGLVSGKHQNLRERLEQLVAA